MARGSGKGVSCGRGFFDDFLRKGRRQYSCGIGKTFLQKGAEKTRRRERTLSLPRDIVKTVDKISFMQ